MGQLLEQFAALLSCHQCISVLKFYKLEDFKRSFCRFIADFVVKCRYFLTI